MSKFSVQKVVFYETKIGIDILKPGDKISYNDLNCVVQDVLDYKIDLQTDGGLLTVDLEYFIERFKPVVKKKMTTIIKK